MQHNKYDFLNFEVWEDFLMSLSLMLTKVAYIC